MASEPKPRAIPPGTLVFKTRDDARVSDTKPAVARKHDPVWASRGRRMNAPFHMPRPEWEGEVVKVFRDHLREVRELETERLRFSVQQLEFLRDGLAELRADLRRIWR